MGKTILALITFSMCLLGTVIYADNKTDGQADNSNFYFLNGLINSKIGYYAAAIKDYTKAIELDPKDVDAYAQRGFAKNNLYEYTGAVQDYTKAIELDPKFADVYYTRGCVKSELKDKTGALEDLSKAGELGYTDAYKEIKRIHGTK